MRIVDGLYEEVRDDSLTVSRAITAGGGPLFPPADWYSDPGLDKPTPITVTPEGRVFGHIATWDADHIGLPPGTKPPHSRTDYAYFKTGVLQLDDGSETYVGNLTLAGGHAPMTAGAAEAVRHYDDTASSVADITIGEDRHGAWVSGGLRPGVTDEQIRILRASAPSGDWRPIDGALELVAVCQVNVPGFPVARAMVASGEVTALVAAGAGLLFDMQQERAMFDALNKVENRVRELETIVASFPPPKKKKAEDDDDKAVEKDDDEPAKDEKPAPSDDAAAKKDAPADDPDADRKAKLREKFKKRSSAK